MGFEMYCSSLLFICHEQKIDFNYDNPNVVFKFQIISFIRLFTPD